MAFDPIELHEVYCVSRRIRSCSKSHIEELQNSCVELPIGYTKLLAEFGIGFLNDIQIFDLSKILSNSVSFRQSLIDWFELYFELGSNPAIEEEFCNNAIILAKTGWGDSYFCSPTRPGVLWFLSRPQDWDSSVDILPLGFSNPFVHQNQNGDLASYGMDDLIFTPANPRANLSWVAMRDSSNESLSQSCSFVEQYFNFDKRTETKYSVSYYAQSLTLVLGCSLLDNGIRLLFEFDDDMQVEIERLVKKMSKDKMFHCELEPPPTP